VATKLTIAVLPAMYPETNEPAEDFARRVEASLVIDRKPILG
jgi:hypothetical protein